jgi:hypothetical protein
MTLRADKQHWFLSYVLAASLLLLGWFQLHHELTAHLESDGAGCQICVFAGHLGDGITASQIVLDKAEHPLCHTLSNHYAAPYLALLFRSALSQRGPPVPSPV